MHYSRSKKIHTSRGFTLFIAALVSSVLLSLAIYMAGIARKELILTNLGRESQYAFYAADAGAECALYMDFKALLEPGTSQTSMQCSNQLVKNLTNIALPDGSFDVVFNTPLKLRFEQAGRCVLITIEKVDVVAPLGELDAGGTIIQSKGYNTSCATTTSPRRLERGIRLQY
jgi:hypothetical protein